MDLCMYNCHTYDMTLSDVVPMLRLTHISHFIDISRPETCVSYLCASHLILVGCAKMHDTEYHSINVCSVQGPDFRKILRYS